MKLHVNTWFQIRTKDKKGSPIGKAHIMAKKPFMVRWENLPKYLASLIIFVSNVYAFRFGMQLTPYMLNLRVANRLGSNKIQCSLAYKFFSCCNDYDMTSFGLLLFLPGWYDDDVRSCLIHVHYQQNGVISCQICNLLPMYVFLFGLFLNADTSCGLQRAAILINLKVK